MPYVDAVGARLYFEEHGDGYPIIFVHEFGSDHREWSVQVQYFSRAYRCITYNARGYPPSDVPEDAALYGWEVRGRRHRRRDARSWDRTRPCGGPEHGWICRAAVWVAVPRESQRDGRSRCWDPALLLSQRDAWLRETSVLARVFIERGMDAMAQRMARGPTRIQLKYKDPKGWQEFVDRLRQHSPRGMSNTMARCQALRPSLHDLRDEFSGMTVPVLLAVGDEDVALRRNQPDVEIRTSECGSLDMPQHRTRHQSGRAGGIQCSGRDTSWELSSAGVGVADIRRPRLNRNSGLRRRRCTKNRSSMPIRNGQC